ncbi:hypothetical protein FU658_05200 [Alkalisalibacterium limincola]|uniref:Uncharacterized protein n=1 Tax=Alkalisalibacterium limincola TaxID=2699169 RepID=A0A5C8KV08_9GAMM|nr:hypothetical protein FU658_05200 [Alkalisalibacterium limincola]
MSDSRGMGRGFAWCAVCLLLVACATPGGARLTAEGELSRFGSEAAFAAWLKAERAKHPEGIARRGTIVQEAPVPLSAPPPPAPSPAAGDSSLDRIEVTGARLASPVAGESVTNVQVAGVDEGGIVKRAGDYLVVLRDDVLYTVRLRRDGSEVLELADALPTALEADGKDVWYDEILVSGSNIVLIGFNYGQRTAVSELLLFSIDADGALQRRSRFWIETEDYFDTENYGARLVGNHILISAQLPFAWNAIPDALRWSRRDVATPRWHDLIDLAEVHLPVFALRSPEVHVLSLCPVEDLLQGMMDCQTFGVVGDRGSQLYVSPSSAFLALAHPVYDKKGTGPLSSIFRVPLRDFQAPGFAVVNGKVDSPLQFSERANSLFVATASAPGAGAEGAYDVTRVPLDRFGTAMAQDVVLPDWLVELPYHGALVRFGEDAVWFGRDGRHRWQSEPASPGPMVVQTLDDAPPARFETGIWPQLLQPVPGGLLVFGSDEDEEDFVLGYAAREADGARLVDRYIPGGVELSEMRTHAVNMAGQRDGSLLVGWPVRGREGSESALMFAALQGGSLADRGVLDFSDMPELARQSVAWYGESRVVFLGHRVIGLSGDALIEGQLQGNRVAPLRHAVLERPGR